MFKKIMSLSIAGLLVVSMVGCNSAVEDTEVRGASNVAEQRGVEPKQHLEQEAEKAMEDLKQYSIEQYDEETQKKLEEQFEKELEKQLEKEVEKIQEGIDDVYAKIEEREQQQAVANVQPMNIVLLDNEVVSITLTEKYEEGDEYYKEIGYKATIVNKSDKNLLIGIDGASVNGVMNDPAWATTVMAGKTSYETIYWWVGEDSKEFNPNVFSIQDLANVEFTMTVSDDDTWDRLTEASVVIE